MRPDDRDDPFDEFFREIQRMMDSMTAAGGEFTGSAGFGSDAHFTVYDEDDSIRILGDLPGVDKEDIKVQCDGAHLTVSAATQTSEFQERIDLPVPVDEQTAEATFNNGVLEVTFERTDQSTGIDVS